MTAVDVAVTVLLLVLLGYRELLHTADWEEDRRDHPVLDLSIWVLLGIFVAILGGAALEMI